MAATQRKSTSSDDESGGECTTVASSHFVVQGRTITRQELFLVCRLFYRMPNELFAHIASFFDDPRDVHALSNTVPHLRFLTSEPTTWKAMYLRKFGRSTTAIRQPLFDSQPRICWASEYAYRVHADSLIVSQVNKMRSFTEAAEYLVSMGIAPPLGGPDRGAVMGRYLFGTPGISKVKLGQFLGHVSEPDASCFTSTLNLAGSSFVSALRMFLAGFRMPGEAQQIDRIVYLFAEAYLAANPGCALESLDQAYQLSFACIMINTDLYSPAARRENRGMQSVLRTMEGIAPAELVRQCYLEIAERELSMQVADSESNGNARAGGSDAEINDALRRRGGLAESEIVMEGSVEVYVADLSNDDESRSKLASLFRSVSRVFAPAYQRFYAVLTHDGLNFYESPDDLRLTVGKFAPQDMHVTVRSSADAAAAAAAAAAGTEPAAVAAAAGAGDGSERREVLIRGLSGQPRQLRGWWGMSKRAEARLSRYRGAVMRLRVASEDEANQWAAALTRSLNTGVVELVTAEIPAELLAS